MSDKSSAEQAASNSLGLDLEALEIKDDPGPAPIAEDPAEDAAQQEGPEAKTNGADESPSVGGKKEPKEKRKPYVNPDRVNTGGAQRDKLTKEELEERMTRIREQNEKIKQRRLDVQADEDEYKKMQETERAKRARAQKVQENVDKAREQNARRKMDKKQSREWDSGKPASRDWKSKNSQPDESTKEDGENSKSPSVNIRGAVRGGGRGGGRGRGRGGVPAMSPTSEKATPSDEKKDAAPPATTAPQEAVATSS